MIARLTALTTFMPNYLKPKSSTRNRKPSRLYYTQRWKRYRKAVLSRQGGICEHCNDTPPDHMLHLDHIQPLAQGGEPFNDDNIQVLCVSCHAKKTAKEGWGAVSNK